MEDENAQEFYDIGGYRHNVRRYKDGIDQLNDIQLMLKERMEIEAAYSKCLQSFHEKWAAHAGRLATGVLRTAWQEVLGESAELQRLHANVKERICDELTKTIGLYLKENHHPSTFRAPKEVREIEEDFEKAQRPWRKQFERVEKARKAFHVASKAERSAQIQMKNASGDTSISVDGEGKFRERWQKCQDDVTKTEKLYRTAIEDLNDIKESYITHMNDVFEACQQRELKRLKFVFEMLSGLQKVLVDIATASKLNQLHRRLEKNFERDDDRFAVDLKEWSRKYGPDYETVWPTFEPYTPSLHNIAAKKEKNCEGDVVLTRQIIKSDDPRRDSVCSANSKRATEPRISKSSISSPLSNGASSEAGVSQNGRNSVRDGAVSALTASTTTVEEVQGDGAATSTDSVEEVCDSERVLYTAKVLYDYEAQDSDELSIRKGNMIEVLGEPDRLNWSFGRADGRTGLFPASYVRPV